MQAFIGGFLRFECKKGKRVQLLKSFFFQLNFLIQGYGWIEG